MTITKEYFDIPDEHRSIYYANDLCDALEKPKDIIFRGIDSHFAVLSLVASVALWILLAVPAAVGHLFSKVIYWTTGEKIKNYQNQLDQWQEKVHNPLGNDNELRGVLDGLIRNRIKVSDCPFDTIQTFDFSKPRGVDTLFAFEGPLHAVKSLDPKRKKFLILISPRSYNDATVLYKRIQSKNPTPTDEEIRHYYQNHREKTDRKYADKCAFVWVPPMKTISSIGEPRKVDSSVINLVRQLFEAGKEQPIKSAI